MQLEKKNNFSSESIILQSEFSVHKVLSLKNHYRKEQMNEFSWLIVKWNLNNFIYHFFSKYIILIKFYSNLNTKLIDNFAWYLQSTLLLLKARHSSAVTYVLLWHYFRPVTFAACITNRSRTSSARSWLVSACN